MVEHSYVTLHKNLNYPFFNFYWSPIQQTFGCADEIKNWRICITTSDPKLWDYRYMHLDMLVPH